MFNTNDISQFTDCYFSKSKTACAFNDHNPTVVWQVFQKHDAIFCGLGLIRHILDKADEFHSLADGDKIEPWEPAIIVKSPVQDFIEFETVYLGIIARATRIATNVRRVVDAANGKPVLFFPARFDVPETQFYDGYAAYIGGAAGCATQEQTNGFNYAAKLMNGSNSAVRTPSEPVGTMPHALIAAYGGDVVEASLASAYSRPNEAIWALVDFHNDCAADAVAVYNAFKDRGMADRLAGVRLDTSEKLIDAGVLAEMKTQFPESIKGRTDAEIAETQLGKTLRGVQPALVTLVRQALDAVGAQSVKIGVSGGFSVDKIKLFEANGVPADVYAVGESLLAGANAFTSDIVARFEGANLIPCSKVGRELRTSNRLTMFKGNHLLTV